jgi:hypothetical protein
MLRLEASRIQAKIRSIEAGIRFKSNFKEKILSQRLKGGCLCGAVRYEAKAEPQFSIICCCRQCQQLTGTGHAPQFALPKAPVTVSGDPKVYRVTADSGNVVSCAFCSNCGSPVHKASSGYPDVVFFYAATLDDPSLFKPQAAVWAKSKQPWDHLDPSIPVRA